MAEEVHLSVPRQRILMGRELKYRIVWLIRLRYGAVAGVVLALFGAERFLGATVEHTPILATGTALLGYNSTLHLVVHRVRFRNWFSAGYAIAALQIFLDLLLLTTLIHQIGGLDNPLVFFYVFHAIIAAILLSRRAAYVQATAAVLMLSLMALLEQTDVLCHHNIGVLLRVEGWGPTSAVLGSVAATLYLAVYLTSSLSRELRARELRALVANEKLLAQDRLKNEYVRLIAHDLKDPLAAIQSTLRVVLDGYAGDVSDKARGFVERAEKQAQNLAARVREMLDLSRIRSAAELERERFSYVGLVREVVESLQPKADASGQDVVVTLPEDSLDIWANRRAMEQVVLNLVGNALKYTPDGGQVNVSVIDRGGRFDTHVADSGIGIPAEAQARVFDEFYRAPNAKRQTRDGTGLGLSCVRQVVTVYGGTIAVESPWPAASADSEGPGEAGAPGGADGPRGTRFTVSFDRNALRTQAAFGSDSDGDRDTESA